MRTIALALGLLATQGLGQSNDVTFVSPSSAAQGSTGQLVTFTLDTDFPPAPPAGVQPSSVTIGGISGSSVTHTTQYTVTALFDIPLSEAAGTKDVTITWIAPEGGTVIFSKTAGFTVTAGTDTPPTVTSGPQPRTVAPGSPVVFTATATGSAPMSYQWQKDEVDLGSATTEPSHTIDSATLGDQGDYRCIATNDFGSDISASATLTVDPDLPPEPSGYVMVDTAQDDCYGTSDVITPPAAGEPFHGQDAQHLGTQPSYTVSGDLLSVYDNNTGLTWQRSPDSDDDGDIDASDKLSWTGAQAYPATLNATNHGGYDDWRLPSIKELYSLMDFRGVDPSGYEGTDTSGLIPFIDTAAFEFAYGDTAAGERIIDSQYASNNLYVGNTANDGGSTLFGVNFADGRIKGYGLSLFGQDKTFFVICCRGNPTYGINNFVDNDNGTVTDQATGLMWQQADSGSGHNWENALDYAENAALTGFSDWRLPDAKELQGILDYTRSPDTTGSAAIDPVFTCTGITNEAGAADYPSYWTGTTHANWSQLPGRWGAYVAFGRAMGYMSNSWVDVHGAGAQRSDPKYDDGTDYSSGNGPQGDAVRIDNYVRLVRTVLPSDDSVGDGIPDAWRAEHFGGTGTTTTADSAADADPDGDGCNNLCEYSADTDPNNPLSWFSAAGAGDGDAFAVGFQSSAERVYTLWRSLDMSDGSWEQVAGQVGVPGSGGVDSLLDATPPADHCFYRVVVSVPD